MRRIVCIFSCVAAMLLVVSGRVTAQSPCTTTLQHGDNITVFYDRYSFAEALDAASDGDIITLSAGTFQAANITKMVKIYGTGFSGDNLFSTHIDGEIQIIVSNDDDRVLYVEGVDFIDGVYWDGTLPHISLYKCRLGYWSGSATNVFFNSCRIWDFNPGFDCKNTFLSNCVIHNMHDPYDVLSSIGIINSIVLQIEPDVLGYFKNSIIGGSVNDTLANLLTADNCMFVNINYYERGSEKGLYSNCWRVTDSDITEIFDGVYTDIMADLDYNSFPFKLTDSAAALYIGTDSTQIGIYGGQEPYSDIPSIPAITSSNIPSYTTKDGKLDVRINVEVQR